METVALTPEVLSGLEIKAREICNLTGEDIEALSAFVDAEELDDARFSLQEILNIYRFTGEYTSIGSWQDDVPNWEDVWNKYTLPDNHVEKDFDQ